MIGMKIKVENVEKFKDRHGKQRLYYRVYPGPRTPLRGPEGSPEFWEDYHVAASKYVKKPNTNSGTIRWLCVQYFKSAAFKQLKQNTQKVRHGILDRFCLEHGEKRFSHLRPKDLMKIRDKMTDRPESANGLTKALRQLFKYAIAYDHIASNPASDVGYLKPNNPDGFHAWTLAEVEKFEATHPIGTKARLAMSILLYTGQRRGDVIGFGRQHISDGWLSFTQQKTGKAMEIPVLSVLREIIDASPKGDLTFIVTEFNRPFSSAGFGNRFRKWCDEAGLKQCSAHGLRKAAAARLADIGCTTLEIMSITGHDSIKEVERYTRSAEQKRLAGNVKLKFEGEIENKLPQTLPDFAPNLGKIK
jgi:integrase